jgi:hypothetical protein
MNINTIKSVVRKKYPEVKIVSVEKKQWGIFVVKVSKQMPKSIKKGSIIGEWNGSDSTLDKIDWY